MRYRSLALVSLAFYLLTGGIVAAATPPAKVVEQFIEAHLQGRFAESRSLTLARVNLSASPFSNWLFGSGGGGGDAATADLFLSRKFTQVFRYTITGTTATGDNQVSVAVIRTSPNLAHLYTWALAPKRGAAPYEVIDALDTYLTKINFPVEESRMQFLLVREVENWHISAVFDDKFAQLQQLLQGQTQLSSATALPRGPAPTGAATGTGAPPDATTTSGDIGRQLADAQFNATLQGFNRAYQGPAAAAGPGSPTPPKPDEDEPGFLGKIARSIFGGGKGPTAAKGLNPSVNKTFTDIRDALARFAVGNNSVPDISLIYDWKSLRRLVNQYGKTPLPATEAEAGFTLVNYTPAPTRDSYIMLVELHEPQDGIRRVEITPYGVDRAN